jgi:hypothetical protein
VTAAVRVGAKSQVQFVGLRQASSLAGQLGAEVAPDPNVDPLQLGGDTRRLAARSGAIAGARCTRRGGHLGYVRWSTERGPVHLGDH